MRQPVTTTKPLVSVIIPSWNAEKTLAQTLASLQAQDFHNWEAFIIDDGSTDQTRWIIAEYCQNDPRITTFSTHRSGPSVARNLAGLKRAQGEYLAFLDSDDLWKPNKLSATISAFHRDPALDAAYAQIAFFRDNPQKPETFSTIYKNQLQPMDFLRDNPVCTMSNLVMKTSLFQKLKGFDETIIHNEDVELLVRATVNGAIIRGVDANLVSYRTSLTGLSADLKMMRAGWFKAVETLQATPFRLSARELAAADAGNLRYLARRALRTGAPGFEALRFAMLGMTKSPASFLNPLWRGGLTFAGALTAPFLPPALRQRAFSR